MVSQPYTVGVEQAKKNLYAEVARKTYEMGDLIPPEDVDEEAETWEEVSDDDLDQAMMDALDHAGPSERCDGAIRECAVKLYLADLPRAPMRDLAFDSMEKAVENGYWPYKMDHRECEELLWETEEFPAYNEAYQTAARAYSDMMDPREEVGY
jgi:hypothetical protein